VIFVLGQYDSWYIHVLRLARVLWVLILDDIPRAASASRIVLALQGWCGRLGRHPRRFVVLGCYIACGRLVKGHDDAQNMAVYLLHHGQSDVWAR